MRAVAIVDKFCGFGSYSDKIYVSNRAAAATLFDQSWAAFCSKMELWAAQDQTEAFLQRTLHANKVLVLRYDLQRADVRYVRGPPRRLCTPYVYYYCSPALQHTDIKPCSTPPPTPMDRVKDILDAERSGEFIDMHFFRNTWCCNVVTRVREAALQNVAATAGLVALFACSACAYTCRRRGISDVTTDT